MKLVTLTIAAMFFMLMSSQVFAEKGGQPGAHGVSGKEFGAAVSSAAQSSPGAVGDHASGGKRNGGSGD